MPTAQYSSSRIVALVAILLTALFATAASVQAQMLDDPDTFYGSEAPPEGAIVVDVIDDFESDTSQDWTIAAGSDLTLDVEFQWTPDEYDHASLAIRCWLTAPPINQNVWLGATRQITAQPGWSAAEAIRVAFAWREDAGHWMEVYIHTESGAAFSLEVFRHMGFGESKIANRVLPFSAFEHVGGPIEALDPTKIVKVIVGASVGRNNNLYLHHLDLVRWAVRDGGVEVTTQEPLHNLFDPGEPVILKFTPTGVVPSAATGLRYEIRTYFGEVENEGVVSWPAGDPALEYEVELTEISEPGFYEVRAYWTGVPPGQNEFSIVIEHPDGTMPFGLHAFAILPRTEADSRAGLHEGSFFGVFNPRPGDLDERMGASWGIMGWRWSHFEETQPIRTPPDSMAQWAVDAIAQGPAAEDEFYLLNFVHFDNPDWVDQTDIFQDNWTHWDDYLAFVRDSVRVHVARYSHMDHRLYDFLWEVDLFMDTGREPNMSVEQVMNIYERVTAIVEQEDPDGLILGLCPGRGGGTLWLVGALFSSRDIELPGRPHASSLSRHGSRKLCIAHPGRGSRDPDRSVQRWRGLARHPVGVGIQILLWGVVRAPP